MPPRKGDCRQCWQHAQKHKNPLGLAKEAHERGELLLAGAFVEPADRALLVWASEDEDVVRRFAEADPYVRNGLVKSWSIRKWNVVVGDV